MFLNGALECVRRKLKYLLRNSQQKTCAFDNGDIAVISL
jgi:hypothetical protein